MSLMLEEEIMRWRARLSSVLILEIIQAWVDRGRTQSKYDLAPVTL